MLRRILDAISISAAWLNGRRRIRTSDRVVRINLGSALVVAPGWINVDGSLNALFAGAPTPILRWLYKWSGSRAQYSRDEYCRILKTNRFVHHDFAKKLPLYDHSVDYVFSSHLLEHLFREEGLRLLKDIHRVLKPGGWVRICVPDLSHAVALLKSSEKDRALAYFFATSSAGYLNRHQYMYDFELLRTALDDSGFTRILRRTFQEGEVPDLEILDNRPDETLYVEAQK